MVDECYEIKEYIKGKRCDVKRFTPRFCLHLIKYYLQEKKYKPHEVRLNVVEFAEKNGLDIKLNINRLIKYVTEEDTTVLSRDVEVIVTQNDVNEINSRFITKKAKMCALAFLCYSKFYLGRKDVLQQDGFFPLYQVDFANWLNIRPQNLSKYVTELEQCGYIRKIHIDKKHNPQVEIWGKHNHYKLLVESKGRTQKEKVYKLKNNDINKLFEEILVT